MTGTETGDGGIAEMDIEVAAHVAAVFVLRTAPQNLIEPSPRCGP